MLKKILVFVLCALALVMPCFAVEPDPSDIVDVEGYGEMTYGEYYSFVPSGTPYTLVEPDITAVPVESPELVSSPVIENTPAPVLAEEPVIPDEYQLVGVEILSSVAPVTPADADGLKAIILSLIGTYDPIVAEYQYQNSNNQYYSYLREIQPDYPWLCSCAIFLLLIFCIFKAGGAVLCRR